MNAKSNKCVRRCCCTESPTPLSVYSNGSCALVYHRDLTDNQLVTLPLAGLGGLTHLKLKDNPALSEAFTKESFPKIR